MIKEIIRELKEHYPFTLFGALTGIILMMAFRQMPHAVSNQLFFIFHPLHVFLSAIVTTGIYCRYKSCDHLRGWNLGKVLAVGIIGSLGIGTLSDSLIPFWGEILMDMPHRHAHIGFLEHPMLLGGAVLAGIGLSYFRPMTKHPHAGHVLISTWASLFHMHMAADQTQAVPYFGIFVFLFLAVWIPCCLSDIIFPMLFVKDKEITCRRV